MRTNLDGKLFQVFNHLNTCKILYDYLKYYFFWYSAEIEYQKSESEINSL